MKLVPLRHPILIRSLMSFVLIVGGCGRDEGGSVVYPVSGKVLVDGKPAEKARITFHPSSNSAASLVPYAETEADGTFRPSTRTTGDGAPAGDYTLTILWPEIRVDHGEEIAGRDRLGGLLGNPQTSRLKVTIKEGENALPPFELKSSR